MPEKPEKPPIPPLRKPVQEFTTPVPTQAFYSETVNRDSDAYQQVSPIARGTLYSSILGAKQEVVDSYPNLYFLRETRLAQSDQIVIWTWATDPTSESSYNSEITYFLESTNTPVFTRVYTIRRDVYDNSTPTPRGSVLTALIGVNITNGGENYTHATGVVGNATVTFVCGNGQIISGIVTNEGSGVTTGSNITVTGDGGNGTATAITQPLTATLISEVKKEFPENHPLRNEYVQVVRVYRNPTGPQLLGQNYLTTYNVSIPFSEQETPAGQDIGTNLIDITPIDTVRQSEKKYDITALAATLNAYHNVFTDKANLSGHFPHFLQSISCVMSKNVSQGDSAMSGAASTSGPHGGYSLSGPDTHSSSCSIIPTLFINILAPFYPSVDVTRHQFFLPLPVTPAQVLAKFTQFGLTVNPWPNYSPTETIIATSGMKVSLQVHAQADVYFSYTPDTNSEASTSLISSSQDLAAFVDERTISPTVHGVISVSGVTSSTQTVSDRALVNITGTVTGYADTGTKTATASATVSPTIIPATSGSTSIPNSGLYLLNADARLFGYGFAFYDAVVVDASLL